MKRPQGYGGGDSTVKSRPKAVVNSLPKKTVNSPKKSEAVTPKQAVISPPEAKTSRAIPDSVTLGIPARITVKEPLTDTTKRLPRKTAYKTTNHRTPEKRDKAVLASAMRVRRRYERQEIRRFTSRGRKRRLVIAVGLIMLLLAVIMPLGIAYSPLMAVKNVVVEGLVNIPAADVQKALSPEIGKPLALVQSSKIQQELSSFAMIETYSLHISPPSTLQVRIVERVPVGVIDTGKGLELVDIAGAVIGKPETKPADQPIIETPGGLKGDGFRSASGVIHSLPNELKSQVAKVSAVTADDVQLQLTNGITVVWGSSQDSALKASVLSALLKVSPPGTASRYDVSAPSSPITG